MRMNKILAASCVLAAASSVAVGGSGTRIVQADGSGYIMDSKETQKDDASKKSDSYFVMDKELSDGDQKKLFAEYEESGILEKDGVLYYRNKPVRCFSDTGRILEEVNEAGGKTITYRNICTYVNWSGTVDIYIIRKETTNKAESSAAYGKIESVEEASSIGDMVPFVSAESLTKIVATGYDEDGISAVYEVLPFLPQEAIDDLAKKAVDNGNSGELKALVQFLSEETVAKVAETEYGRTGIAGVYDLLPYMSEESVDKLAAMVRNGQTGISDVNGLLPYMPQESIDTFAKEAADNGNYDALEDLAQFLSEEVITEIVNSEYERTGLSGVRELLPFMSQKSVGKLARKAADRNDIDSLEQVAFLLDVDLLDKIAKDLDSRGQRVAGIAPFMSDKVLKEVVEKAYKRAGASGIYEFLSSMPKSLVNKYIQKAAAAKDYDGVEKMAPYASKKVLKKIADKMLAAGKSIAGIEAFIK